MSVTYYAHAFGQRYELPIPLLLFIGGGAAIVVASFLVIMPRPVAPLPDGDTPADVAPVGPLTPVRSTVSLVVLGLLIFGGFYGSQAVAENILPTLFWLVVWIAVPLSCGILGDWTRSVNPFAFLARLADRPRLRRVLLGGEAPVAWRLGWWPAVALFFVTACGELIFNEWAVQPAHTALCLAVYALISATGGLLFGPAWLERGEMFSVLFSTWGRLGYFRFGAPGRRRFAGGLDVPFEPSTSRLAFTLLLLVSVNFDGLLATPSWNRLETATVGASGPEWFRTATFVTLALVVAALFGLFARAASRAGGQPDGYRRALAGLLPSLLPIAFGYLLAHNIEYIAVNSQLLAPLLGNPPGVDGWPIHLRYPFNDSYEVHPHFLPTAFYWYVSVAVIITVHVIAVVIAHRHLGERATTVRTARASEYPWLAAMVAYTMLSLWLIAQPLVKEAPSPAPATAAPAAQILTSRTAVAARPAMWAVPRIR